MVMGVAPSLNDEYRKLDSKILLSNASFTIKIDETGSSHLEKHFCFAREESDARSLGILAS